MNDYSLFSSHEITPMVGALIIVLYFTFNRCRCAVAYEELEGKQWMALYQGGGRMFWTLFSLCSSRDEGVWQFILGLYNSEIEDVAVGVDVERTVVVTELVGRQRWIRLLRSNSVERACETIFLLKFEKRELQDIRALSPLVAETDRGVDDIIVAGMEALDCCWKNK